MQHRSMTVKGIGEASLPPDTIQLDFYLEARAETYDQTINLATQQLEQLRSCLEKVGFTKTDLLTTQFSVDTDYESVKNEDDQYIRVFKGYIVRNNLKLSFPLDNPRLGRVLENLSHCDAHPEFSIHYLLKDEQALKTLLLTEAVANATQNAKTLALASHVTLGEIIAIDYDWNQIQYQTKQFNLSETASYAVAQIDLQPDQITATDVVTLTWAIGNGEPTHL